MRFKIERFFLGIFIVNKPRTDLVLVSISIRRKNTCTFIHKKYANSLSNREKKGHLFAEKKEIVKFSVDSKIFEPLDNANILSHFESFLFPFTLCHPNTYYTQAQIHFYSIPCQNILLSFCSTQCSKLK